MKYKILPTKNISRMRTAGDALLNRSPGMPGMGLIWAPTGYCKTTAATWFINQVNGVYVRALRLWSPKAMLTMWAMASSSSATTIFLSSILSTS